jgi:hypothetical protein
MSSRPSVMLALAANGGAGPVKAGSVTIASFESHGVRQLLCIASHFSSQTRCPLYPRKRT